MLNQVKGTKLSKADQITVLNQYVNRFTGNHRPYWVDMPDRSMEYQIQFTDDNDWLEHTLFKVKKNGRLDKQAHYCESNPTWPNGIGK